MSSATSSSPTEELFRLSRAKSHCEVISRVDRMKTPSVEMCALRVYGLLRTGDPELALCRLAQLVVRIDGQPERNDALRRWVHSSRPARMQLGEILEAIDRFYVDWDAKTFWRYVLRSVGGRELDFIAAILTLDLTAYRVLVALADSMKLRGDARSAFEVYLNMCRVRPSDALVKNVLTLAVRVHPELLPSLLSEFCD